MVGRLLSKENEDIVDGFEGKLIGFSFILSWVATFFFAFHVSCFLQSYELGKGYSLSAICIRDFTKDFKTEGSDWFVTILTFEIIL